MACSLSAMPLNNDSTDSRQSENPIFGICCSCCILQHEQLAPQELHIEPNHCFWLASKIENFQLHRDRPRRELIFRRAPCFADISKRDGYFLVLIYSLNSSFHIQPSAEYEIFNILMRYETVIQLSSTCSVHQVYFICTNPSVINK